MRTVFTERLSTRNKLDGEIALVAFVDGDDKGAPRLLLPDDYSIRPREARRLAAWILANVKVKP